MLKCTRAPGGQPAIRRCHRGGGVLAVATLIAACCLAIPSRLSAQSVTRETEFFAGPGERPLATLRRGTAIDVGATRGGFVQANIAGWLAASLVGPARDSFPLTVKPVAGARLRDSASSQSPVLAELRGGMGLVELSRQEGWIHVRRTGWVRAAHVGAPVASRVDRPPPPASASPIAGTASPPPLPRSDTSRFTDDSIPLTPTVETMLATAPSGERVGTLAPGALAAVTGRDRGWVRVRVEGWAREGDFMVADSADRGALSAADLRADPAGTRGRIVHWEVMVLARQIADPLRRGLANQEPYFLAQGPGRENALLYLAIPPALLATSREIADLSTVTITARVRHGRSEPVGVPVLDLISIVRR